MIKEYASQRQLCAYYVRASFPCSQKDPSWHKILKDETPLGMAHEAGERENDAARDGASVGKQGLHMRFTATLAKKLKN